jgi:periplasmic copper chaperone A
MTRPLRPLRPLRLPALLGAALVLAACGGDADGELQVLDMRSRMSPMMTGVGAVYLDIANTTEVDDALLGASVDASVAGKVELHETFDADAEAGEGMDDDAMDDDAMDDHAMGDGFAMMGMREIERLEIPAGSTVRLVPGGHHLMLLDLAQDLVPGTEFDLTLIFAEAGEMTVPVEVREDV